MASGRCSPVYKKKCLENPKVQHDGTDDRDPNFDVCQDIQSQNDFSVMQLNGMGYGGDVLQAKFLVDKICERQAVAAPVTVAQTCKHQANTVDKHFFATGGGTHITTDDGLIAAEMKVREAEVAEKEKERKQRKEFYERCKSALIVLNHLKHQA